MIRHINSFGTENASNIKNIPPSSSVHSNLYQHQFSFCKWHVRNIANLNKSPLYFVEKLDIVEKKEPKISSFSFKNAFVPTENRLREIFSLKQKEKKKEEAINKKNQTDKVMVGKRKLSYFKNHR